MIYSIHRQPSAAAWSMRSAIIDTPGRHEPRVTAVPDLPESEVACRSTGNVHLLR